MHFHYSYPIHLTLLVLNAVGALVTFLLGTFLVYMSRKGASMGHLLQELTEDGIEMGNDGQRWRLREMDELSEHGDAADALRRSGMALGVLCFLFGIYLAKRTFDLAVILWVKDETPFLGRYRQWMAAHFRRHIQEAKEEDEDKHQQP